MGQRHRLDFHSMVPDLIPADAPAEAWNTANNVAFRNGETIASGADLAVMPSATINPKTIVYVEPFDQGFWVYADESGCFANDGTTEFNITPDVWGPHGIDTVFTSAVTNGLVTINSSNFGPAYWDGNTSNIMLPLPDWPVGGTCMALRGHKNFLMAVGMTSEGGQRVRWSTAAEAGTIPQSWTPLAGNQAGFVDLAPLSSSCLDGLSMRDEFLIYKRETTWRMAFVGGNDIFAVQKASAEQGVAATNGVVRGPNDNHLLVTSDGDIARYDGINYQSVLSGRAQRTFYDDFKDADGSVFSVWMLNRENLGGVVFPRSNDTVGTRILLFDFDSGDISFRDAPDVLCAASGRYLQDVGDQNQWDGDNEDWDSDSTSWNQEINAQTVEDVLLGVEGGIMHLGGSITALDVSLEKSAIQLGNNKQRKMIDRVWPKFEGSTGDVVQFRLGGQEIAGGPTTLTDPLPYTIGSGLPIDAFIQGRFLTMLVESSGTDVWRLGSVEIEFREMGQW